MTKSLENRYLDILRHDVREIISLGNLQLAAPPSSPLDNDDQESCLSVMDKWEIAGISVRHHSTNDQTPLDLEDNEPKQGAEAPAGKKGTLHALRR